MITIIDIVSNFLLYTTAVAKLLICILIFYIGLNMHANRPFMSSASSNGVFDTIKKKDESFYISSFNRLA
jgi:hypothetical protein